MAYAQFLNGGVTPAMPADGSIGEADITILSHVGLAMLGEGDVYYQGHKLAAADALKSAGLTTPALVALSQLVAFVAYQLRVAVAAQALQARAAT
ncbi:aromatic amino acid ammonia-lyase, partial [Clostridioides difficile]|nr:aromatic amino acid ammonia-lyase [Clostridioides difficile]